jgi:hypothetical protein
MLRIVDDEWLVDTEALLCSNNLTKIVVGFEKRGETFIGKIKDMPIELTVRLAKMKDGDLLLKKAVLDAEEIFNKEMFEMNEKIKTG